MKKQEPYFFGKLPPQAVDLEEQVLAVCLSYDAAHETIPHLKPEHFYKDSHQTIFKAIRETENQSKILVVTKYLKSTGKLDEIGGAYYLSQLMAKAGSWAGLESWSFILLEFWLKRELIRLGGEISQKAYDVSQDVIDLFDHLSNQLDKLNDIFTPITGSSGLISTQENEQEELNLERTGTRQTGLITGYSELDQHFRFKPGNFVVINGLDNVGKTAMITHLAVISNHLHGWRWMMACMENSVVDIRVSLIQSKTGKHITRLSDQEFEDAHKWAYDNFMLFDIRKDMSASEILRKAERIHNNDKRKFNAFLIDPYNSLRVDLKESKLSSHEYHYEATTAMRNFSKRTGCGVWVNTHAITEATRRKYTTGDKYDGFIQPPDKGDVEGGGKFANRADDFLTIHRLLGHVDEHNITQVHVRKIKDTSTGGRITMKDFPVKLKTIKHYFGFFDMDGNSPLIDKNLPGPDPSQPDIPF